MFAGCHAQVKRSRDNAKRKKEEHERLCCERESENAALTQNIVRLRDDITFLTKVRHLQRVILDQKVLQSATSINVRFVAMQVLRNPTALTTAERATVERLVLAEAPVAPLPPQG